jgi:hypothetical protein
LKRSAFVVVVMLFAGVLQGSASTRLVKTFSMPVTGEVSGSVQLTGGVNHAVSLDLQLSGVALQPSSVYIVRLLGGENRSCRVADVPGGFCPVIGALNVDADGNAAGSWSDAPHGSVLPLPDGLAAGLQDVLNPDYVFLSVFLVLEKVPATTDSTVEPGPTAIFLGPLQ